jgi:hypothetical protein
VAEFVSPNHQQNYKLRTARQFAFAKTAIRKQFACARTRSRREIIEEGYPRKSV